MKFRRRGITQKKAYNNVISLLSKNWCVYTVNKNTQDRQCEYKRNIEARSCNQCHSGTAINITYLE